MTNRRTSILIALSLAAGVAVGAAGSTIAASPSTTPTPGADAWGWMGRMMGGAGMMSGPRAGFGAGMMSGLSPAQRNALFQQCDALHDAIHGDAGASIAPSTER